MPAITRWSRSIECSRLDSVAQISAQPLRTDAECLRSEMAKLFFELLGVEQPDTGTLLRAGLGEHEPRASSKTSWNAGVFGPVSPALRYFKRPAVIRCTSSTSSPSAVGKKSRFARRSAPGELPALEARKRRIERLQGRDVRRPRLDDRERGDRIVERPPPGLHLR